MQKRIRLVVAVLLAMIRLARENTLREVEERMEQQGDKP